MRDATGQHPKGFELSGSQQLLLHPLALIHFSPEAFIRLPELESAFGDPLSQLIMGLAQGLAALFQRALGLHLLGYVQRMAKYTRRRSRLFV